MSDFIQYQDLASHFGVSVGTLQAWQAKGTGPVYEYHLGVVLYRQSAVDEWLLDPDPSRRTQPPLGGPQASCQNGACELVEVPVPEPRTGSCTACSRPLVLPVCPEWCEHPTTVTEASCFTHLRRIASMDLSDITDLRMLDSMATVDLCLEGDGDDPSRTATLQVYLPNDCWLELPDVVTLRALSTMLTAAANAAERLLTGSASEGS